VKHKPLVSEKAILRTLSAAGLLWEGGDFTGYFEQMERAARMDPRNFQIPMNLGISRLKLYQYPQAEASFERSVLLAPDKSRALEMIGLHCRNCNRFDLSERYLERACAAKGATADTMTKLAEMYERLRRSDKARDMVQKALRENPSSPLALLVHARLQRAEGDLEKAEQTLRLFLNRSDPESWSTRIRGWYELGLNLDRQEKYDDAMAAFLSAKALVKPSAANMMASQRITHANLAEAAQGISAADLARWTRQAAQHFDSNPKLAFICGHPRSGTTLMEQMLDSHPGVVSAEETDIFFQGYGAIQQTVSPEATILETLDNASNATLVKMRQWYLRSMQSFVGDPIGNRLLIDKNPSLTGLIPAIVRLFPQAKIVVALRDPRDVCLSCFMQPLPLNATSSFYLTLEDTAVEYAALMGLFLAMEHRMPTPPLKFRYEDLVRDQETISRQLLSALGLDWDPRVLKFDEHAREKLVRSPTYADVARPITNRAVGRWRNYQKYLEPCLPKLEKFVAAFGY
jgi:tetratricopeptide (TPR) repeat protein